MASTAMAEDPRKTLKNIESKQLAPEYNLALINQNLESLPDPLAAIQRIIAAKKKREAVDQQRREANRRLQEQFAKNNDELDREVAAAEAEEMQDANQPIASPEEASEPQTTEPLCLVPSQPVPQVDLSPLGLPQSLGRPEALALLQHLMVTRQLFTYTGAFDAESASVVLRVLFDMVAYGENPQGAYQQMSRYYSEADVAEMGWVPQLPDFLTAFTTMGYQAPKGHGGAGCSGGGRKRSVGDGPAQGAEAGGSGAGGSAGGSGGSSTPRLFNVQALLRLLADLSALHMRGRVDVGFGSKGQAAGKGLITALLRMFLDEHMSALLHTDVCAALEGLMQPWDDAVWRRICDDAALTAAELGPSHRAAYRVISAAQGLSDRLRTWQQCAAMQLLRKTAPHSGAGGAGAGGTQRGQVGVDLRQVRTLLGTANQETIRGLLAGLQRPRDKGPVDYWRLLTILQCAHRVVWSAAYGAEGGESDATLRWISNYFKLVEQKLRGQQETVMRIKVFLADVQTNYDLLLGIGE